VVPALAQPVQGPGHHPLASAALAEEQNRRILGRHLLDPEEYIRDGRALTDYLAEVVLPGNLILQVDVLGLEPVLQMPDFRKRSLERLFGIFAFVYFPRKLRVCSCQLSGPFPDPQFQIVVSFPQLILHPCTLHYFALQIGDSFLGLAACGDCVFHDVEGGPAGITQQLVGGLQLGPAFLQGLLLFAQHEDRVGLRLQIGQVRHHQTDTGESAVFKQTPRDLNGHCAAVAGTQCEAALDREGLSIGQDHPQGEMLGRREEGG